jgi:hypothetical protein
MLGADFTLSRHLAVLIDYDCRQDNNINVEKV